MPQPSSSISTSSSLHFVSGRTAASPAVMPGMRPYARHDNSVDPAAESLSRLHEWIGKLDRYLRLPNSFEAFALYLVGLLLVFAGATLHVMVAAQIMQTEYRLAALEQDLIAIEQHNSELMFMIARDSNLYRLREKALALGYVPVAERTFVIVEDANDVTNGAAATQPATQSAQPSEMTSSPAAVSPATTPMRQWERLIRGELVAAPAPAGRATMAAATSQDGDGQIWQSRWQQLFERGRNLFTTTDLR